MKNITARYPGKCGFCGERFGAGAEIAWAPGRSLHAACRHEELDGEGEEIDYAAHAVERQALKMADPAYGGFSTRRRHPARRTAAARDAARGYGDANFAEYEDEADAYADDARCSLSTPR